MNEPKPHSKSIPLTNTLLLIAIFASILLPALLLCLFGLTLFVNWLVTEGHQDVSDPIYITLGALIAFSGYAHYALWQLAVRSLKPFARNTPTQVWVGIVLGLLIGTYFLTTFVAEPSRMRSWDVQSIVLTLWCFGGGYWVAVLGLAPTARWLDVNQNQDKTLNLSD